MHKTIKFVDKLQPWQNNQSVSHSYQLPISCLAVFEIGSFGKLSECKLLLFFFGSVIVWGGMSTPNRPLKSATSTMNKATARKSSIHSFKPTGKRSSAIHLYVYLIQFSLNVFYAVCFFLLICLQWACVSLFVLHTKKQNLTNKRRQIQCVIFFRFFVFSSKYFDSTEW